MKKAKAVFEALPHIKEVWITEDGLHHLHPNNGGTKYTREDVEKKDSKPLPVIEAIKK